ncbi:MAG: hypothetical protein HOE82_08615 [Gammaproteobacteria bacterium]|jgi:hypothetical protein|nr:hypothetical protein [Gammaproteobacteria bacterium]
MATRKPSNLTLIKRHLKSARMAAGGIEAQRNNLEAARLKLEELEDTAGKLANLIPEMQECAMYLNEVDLGMSKADGVSDARVKALIEKLETSIESVEATTPTADAVNA